MKKGLIICNAYNLSASPLYQSERLKDEFFKLGVIVDIKKNNYFAYLNEKAEIINFAKDYDFCVYLDKDAYVCKMLEESGLNVFNSSDAIVSCDDKMLTCLKLKNYGLKIPKTISGLLCYSANAEIKTEDVEFIGKTLGYPVIVKECFSSLGKGVYKAENLFQLREITQSLKFSKRIYQQFISSSFGTDVRLIVIGGKYFSAMKRVSITDFRSNIELGGKGERFEPDTAFINSAEKCAEALKLDYCGVDLLFGENGEPIVCEVNSNAYFKAMESVSKKNVAEAYANYIYKKIYNN